MDLNNRTLKVFLAGLQGGGIGTFVALVINPNFWWVGLVMGAIVGYLAYDWQEVGEVVAQVYHQSIQSFPKIVLASIYNKAKKIFFGVLYFGCYFLAIILMISPAIPFLYNESNTPSTPWFLHLAISVIGITISGALTLFFGYIFCCLFLPLLTDLICSKKLAAQTSKRFPISNPFGEKMVFNNYIELNATEQLHVLINISLLPIISLIGWIGLITYFIVWFIGLIWKCVKILHSNERLVSGLYCLLGVIAGYKTNHDLVGITVGGLVAGILAAGTYRLFLFLATKTAKKTC